MRLESVISVRNSLIFTELHSVGMTLTHSHAGFPKLTSFQISEVLLVQIQKQLRQGLQTWDSVDHGATSAFHVAKLATYENSPPTPPIKTHYPRYQYCLDPMVSSTAHLHI